MAHALLGKSFIKPGIKSLVLGVIFLAVVAIPVAIAFKQLGLHPDYDGINPDKRKIVVPAVRDGRYIEISNNTEINPHTGKDFLLMFWVKLRKMPEPGDRLILASKYAGNAPNVDGYAIGLRRDEDALRPIVFWGPDRGRGHWYDFPEITMVPDSWNLFALSFHKDKFLGLQRVQEVSGQLGDLETLGGYELKDGSGEFSDAPLILGAPPNREFRGFIGPVSIISKRNLSDDFKQIITQFRDDPLTMPSSVDEKNIRLYVLPDLIDHSRFANKVLRRGNW